MRGREGADCLRRVKTRTAAGNSESENSDMGGGNTCERFERTNAAGRVDQDASLADCAYLITLLHVQSSSRRRIILIDARAPGVPKTTLHCGARWSEEAAPRLSLLQAATFRAPQVRPNAIRTLEDGSCASFDFFVNLPITPRPKTSVVARSIANFSHEPQTQPQLTTLTNCHDL